MQNTTTKQWLLEALTTGSLTYFKIPGETACVSNVENVEREEGYFNVYYNEGKGRNYPPTVLAVRLIDG